MPTTSTQPSRAISNIRLSDEAIESLLRRMDESVPAGMAERRRKPRYRHRTKVMVGIQQPGDTRATTYIVPTRNLSDLGISFLFGGFVYLDSQVVIQMRTWQGMLHSILGQVMFCRYVEGNIHEVTVRFRNAIDPSWFCAAATGGRVLLAEDTPSTARLMKHYLQILNAEADHVTTGKAVLDKVRDNRYDLVLMDIEMPEMNGLETAEALRKEGYAGLLIAMTALTYPDIEQQCLKAGFDKFLPKPCSKETLQQVLSIVQDDPLHSTLLDQPAMHKLINEFVNELGGKIRSLQQFIADNDTAGVMNIVRDLKADGAGYGFAPISELATPIEAALQTQAVTQPIREQLDALIRLCHKARPSPSA